MWGKLPVRRNPALRIENSLRMPDHLMPGPRAIRRRPAGTRDGDKGSVAPEAIHAARHNLRQAAHRVIQRQIAQPWEDEAATCTPAANVKTHFQFVGDPELCVWGCGGSRRTTTHRRSGPPTTRNSARRWVVWAGSKCSSRWPAVSSVGSKAVGASRRCRHISSTSEGASFRHRRSVSA